MVLRPLLAVTVFAVVQGPEWIGVFARPADAVAGFGDVQVPDLVDLRGDARPEGAQREGQILGGLRARDHLEGLELVPGRINLDTAAGGIGCEAFRIHLAGGGGGPDLQARLGLDQVVGCLFHLGLGLVANKQRQNEQGETAEHEVLQGGERSVLIKHFHRHPNTFRRPARKT